MNCPGRPLDECPRASDLRASSMSVKVWFGSGAIMCCAMTSVAIILKPIPGGWSVCLTDGRQLARFRGPRARARALRYLVGASARP
jgi:hypothetical protein